MMSMISLLKIININYKNLIWKQGVIEDVDGTRVKEDNELSQITVKTK